MSVRSGSTLLQKLDIQALYNTFLGLEPRQQTLALIGGGMLVLMILGLPLAFASSQISGLEEQLDQGREKQRQVVREIEKLKQLKGTLKHVEARLSQGYDGSITTTMETLAQKSEIKDRIDNIKDRGATPTELFDEVTVDVRVTKITVPQMVDFLYNIEHHPQLFLRVRQIQIKRRYDNKQLLDVTFQASTYKLQAAPT